MIQKYRLPFLIFITLMILMVFIGSLAVAQEGAGGGATLEEEGAGSEVPAVLVVPGGPGFVSLSSMGFIPYNTTQIAFNGQMLYNPDTVSHYYEGALTLPHGANITKFVVYYYDNDATNNLAAYLGKGAFDTWGGMVIGSASSSGNEATYRYAEDTTISSPLIDNQSYSFWVEVSMPPSSNVRLVAVRVDYSFPAVLPVALKP
jgi:hypothetical protein